MTEQQAIKRCVSGEMSAFSTLYDLYIEKIYRFIYYRTHHKETAEDLTSVVFTKAFSKFKSFDPEANFKSWIFQIARNTIIDHHRTNKVTTGIDEAVNVKDKTNIEREFVTKEQIDQVRKYLETLNADQRDLVLMRLWDGLSYSEISEILGKSEPSLRVSFSRIINKMQKEIAIAIILFAVALIN